VRIRIPKREAVHATFYAPPSKSGTHRAFIAGALAQGSSFIQCPLQSEDTDVTRSTLERWGIPFVPAEDGVTIEGCRGTFRCAPGSRFDMKDSGTSMRFFTSLALLCSTPVILDGSDRMRQRPIGPLVRALNAIGGKILFLGREGYPPLRITGELKGGKVVVTGKESSQYISSLLLAAPYAAEDISIRCEEVPVSRSYIDITLAIMEHFGAVVQREGYLSYQVQAATPYRGAAIR
jgi:5-enolpyruvylshikimate-3-phosphate synthase